MKKFILSMAIAAVALVGCDVKDNTPTVFQYKTYVYAVNFSAAMTPAGLVAVEVTYVDANGVDQTKVVTESWTSDPVPAQKGFKMKMTAKLVLAPGQSRPTSGNEANITIAAGIRGVDSDPSTKFVAVELYNIEGTGPTAYKRIIAKLDAPAITREYEIQPILEPGM